MDLIDSGKKERRQSFLIALAVAVGLSVMLAPVVEAAAQRIKGTVTAKIKDSSGDTIDSKATGDLGLFAAEGSSGALAVRTYAGGGGFVGAADCDPATALPDTITLSAPTIVTGVLVTGSDAKVAVSSESVDALFGVPEGADFPVANITTTAEVQTQTLALGNGLSLTAPLKLKCNGTDGNVVALGQ